MATTSHLLEIDGLHVSYGRVCALNGVSLRVDRGEFVGLLGANGAGKSTLLASILGIQRAAQGTIRFDGADITRRPSHQIVSAGVALVPEGRGILPLMTVLENLQVGAASGKGRVKDELDQVFEQFPFLEERKHVPAGSLSGGQQQILAICRGLVATPQLLMMDEPSLGLAPIMTDEILRMVGAFRNRGITVLLSEQNAKKALQYTDRSYILEAGRIILDGKSVELVNNPNVKRAYLGN